MPKPARYIQLNQLRSASLSRPLDPANENPALAHSLYQKCSSVLSLAADDQNIYSGSQADDILVWDKATFTLKSTLQGHTGSVLALQYAPDRKWLFSASGDSSVRVWSTTTLTPLFRISPHLDSDSGDIFSLAWSPSLSTIYFGCQNTSLQWYAFSEDKGSIPCPPRQDPPFDTFCNNSGTATPRRAHKFFDSYPQYTRRAADLNARNSYRSSPSPPESSSPPTDGCLSPALSASMTAPAALDTPAKNMVWSAHYGYIYCMALSPSTYEGSDDKPASAKDEIRLVTGSGDSSVKLWSLPAGVPTLEHTFDCGSGAVLALTVRANTVYAGCQDGYVKVLDLETRTCVRTILVQEGVDVLSMSMLDSDLYTCSANGQIQRWSSSFDLSASWDGHSGIILSSLIVLSETPKDNADGASKPRAVLITGGNDDYIKLWDVEPPTARISDQTELDQVQQDPHNDTLLYALSKFISIPSISGHPRYKEDCRQAAIWLRKCLSQLGAESSLISTGEDNNPLVLATFHGAQTQTKIPRILFYGHYDVIDAHKSGWSSDPFQLLPLNGYLYGRGVTDNKGPIMAVACAAASLLRKRALDVDLVMLVEGEEESGSRGFSETVKKYKDQIGEIDAILVSNSTWISETTPCITYGLRGVIHCEVEISSSGSDLHSGVDGGDTMEPMMDMVKLLGSLTDSKKKVAIPGFYDAVRPLTSDERQLYTVLSGVTQTPASSLSAKWREPALTVHNVEVSGPKNSTVIPATIKARVSLRVVPDQDLDTIATNLQDYLKSEFETFRSPNSLHMSIKHIADWWLGKLDDPWFLALENAIRDEWGVEPLRIREGGSIPGIPYLEKEFSCHALHLPLGQSTDQAHLPNERISLANLQRGQAVLERFFTKVARGIVSEV
ncbi:Zn-dependent exopeptidase [Cristinia sonorae]|uniref:Zn-dependent exopeptidase n=1 Tax=Cristinia sonorae TaxID=1940300 RepID=A0A8K0UFA5_9AGAR|nr:Zn-dependent exopeptidase [Cristinia sonorae]